MSRFHHVYDGNPDESREIVIDFETILTFEKVVINKEESYQIDFKVGDFSASFSKKEGNLRMGRILWEAYIKWAVHHD